MILLRPTQSLALSLQQIGKGMRPAAGKEHLVVLDHAGNCLKHGVPESEREWSLDGAPRRDGEARTAGWRCECGCFNHLEAEACEECGAARPSAERRPPQAIAGQLRELSAEAAARIARMPYRRFLAQPRSERELRVYAEARGYKPGWVWHRLREQQGSNQA